MKKSIFEKKEKNQKVIQRIILVVLFPIIMWGVYGLMFFSKPEDISVMHPLFIFWSFSTLCAFGVVVFLFWEFLGIKIPKSKKQKLLLTEIKELEELFYDKRRFFLGKRKKAVEKENQRCPSCGNRENNVEKIRKVSGKVSGDFSLGFGSVNGETHTEPVNHCSHCGHEWEKEEVSDYYKSEAYLDLVEPIYDFFEKGRNNNDDPLKNFHAEVLRKFFIKNKEYPFLGSEGRKLSNLSVREIRKYTGK